jgi:hypothetical protein
MEVTFKRSNHHVLELSEEQLHSLFDYFNSCCSGLNGEKKYYEGGALGFFKSGEMELVPDIWTPECTRQAETYTMSDEIMKIKDERERNRFGIHHFHSHTSDLPFPSATDPYNVFESIGIFSLGNPNYGEFRTFKQLGCGSYPPALGRIKSGEKISTVVRFDKKGKRIEFLPLEDEVKINVSALPFLFIDW